MVAEVNQTDSSGIFRRETFRVRVLSAPSHGALGRVVETSETTNHQYGRLRRLRRMPLLQSHAGAMAFGLWPPFCGAAALQSGGELPVPAVRDSLAPSDASQILLGNNKLERDAKFIPPTDDPSMRARGGGCEAVAAAITPAQGGRGGLGGDALLHGLACLRRGQHLGICLFEPRYRAMVSRALEGDGTFGIVTTSVGFRAARAVVW